MNEAYERLKFHLLMYGNTVANEKDMKWLPKLEEAGIKVRITEYTDKPDEPLMMARKDRYKRKHYYILERTE